MCLDCTTKAMNAGEFDREIKSSSSVGQAIGKMHHAKEH
jgi:hypothetical protein